MRGCRSGVVLFLLVLSALVACAPRMEVYRISRLNADQQVETVPGNLKHRGVYYALPRTVLTVTVPATLREPIATAESCIAALAGDPRLQRAAIPSRRTLSLGTPVLASRAEPDPAQVFVVEIAPRFVNRMDHTLEITEQGLLTHGASTGRNQALQIGAEVVKFAASVAGRVIGRQMLSPDLRARQAEACSRELDRVLAERRKQRELQLEVAAAAAAGRATEKIEARLGATTTLIEKLLASFFPHKTTSGSIVCEVRPDSENSALFTVVGADDLGDHVRFDVVGDDRCFTVAPFLQVGEYTAQERRYSLQVVADNQELRDVLTKATTKAQGNFCWLGADRCARGLYYRVPIVARATLFGGDIALLEQLVPVAQFGGVTSLPPRSGNLFGGKADLYVYEGTGAVKKLETADEAIPTGMITSLDAAAGAILDADDELKRLQRRKSILELEAAIEKLEQGGGANPGN